MPIGLHYDVRGWPFICRLTKTSEKSPGISFAAEYKPTATATGGKRASRGQVMGHEEQLLKTMSAVQGCIRECRIAESPLAALNRFVQGLRQNPLWQDREIRQVEAAARRALEAAMSKDACGT